MLRIQMALAALLVTATFAPPRLVAQSGNRSKTPPSLNIENFGRFSGPDGIVEIFVAGPHLVALFTDQQGNFTKDTGRCPHGGQLVKYLVGHTLSGGPIQFAPWKKASFPIGGTMFRCTKPRELIDDCPGTVTSLWQTTFTGDFVNRKKITIAWDGEFYPRGEDGKHLCTPNRTLHEITLTWTGSEVDQLRQSLREDIEKLKNKGKRVRNSVADGVNELVGIKQESENWPEVIRENIKDQYHQKN